MKHSAVGNADSEEGREKKKSCSLCLHIYFMDTYTGIYTYDYNTFKAEDNEWHEKLSLGALATKAGK